MTCYICETREGIEHPITGEVLCRDCEVNEAEAAHERMLEDYYGGSGPVTFRERSAEAAAQQRRDRGCGHTYGNETPCPQCPQ